jgi:predicted Zn-dependent peptidase
LLLLDAVLGGGKSGRLFARLRDGETEPVGYDIKTLLTPNRAQSLWTVFVVGESAMKTSRDAITAEFNALADGTRPITAEELTRAKNYLKVRHQQGRQRLKERAFGIGWAETMGLDAAFDTDYAARLDTISLDDVNRMARRVLGGPPAIVYSLPFPKATPEPAATPEPMP